MAGAKKNVGIIQLNRPKALNALCKPLFVELGKAVRDFDADDSISAIIITGMNSGEPPCLYQLLSPSYEPFLLERRLIKNILMSGLILRYLKFTFYSLPRLVKSDI